MIRIAESSDFDVCLKLYSIFRTDMEGSLYGEIYSSSVLLQDILRERISDGLVYVMCTDSAVIGMCMLHRGVYRHVLEYCDIDMLYICPTYRRKGYGTSLMNYILTNVDVEVTLSTPSLDDKLLKFFEKFGFEPLKIFMVKEPSNDNALKT